MAPDNKQHHRGMLLNINGRFSEDISSGDLFMGLFLSIYTFNQAIYGKAQKILLHLSRD
jgi:hypothetical protein